MSRGDFPSAKAPQFPLRFPDGMREALSELAKRNGRSMNSELVIALEKHLASSGVELPAQPKPYNARLDTFVAAALSGLVASDQRDVPVITRNALAIGKRMLATMEAEQKAVEREEG